MTILDIFKTARAKIQHTYQRWRELGTYRATYTAFGRDAYKSEVVRYCIRPLSEHTAKANARCTYKSIERMLNYSPNQYMSGKDFLAKVRTKLELQNTVFILINRDDKGHVSGLYPIPYQTYEAVEYQGKLFIRFTFAGDGQREMFASWQDLAVLRKDYNNYDIGGDDNYAILNTLEMINVTNQGLSNAIKSTSNLRGILKSTKAMLSPVDLKKQRDAFVSDYMSIDESGGIASLDSTMEFSPIKMDPATASYAQMEAFRKDVYRYFGVSESIVTSDYTEAQMEAFYEARIEPFLVALSLELTRKCFTERELGFGAQIIYESNRMQYASVHTKLQMIQMVDRGILTPNELRSMLNLAPYEGGDEFVRRLDTATTGDTTNDSEPAKQEDNSTQPVAISGEEGGDNNANEE